VGIVSEEGRWHGEDCKLKKTVPKALSAKGGSEIKRGEWWQVCSRHVDNCHFACPWHNQNQGKTRDSLRITWPLPTSEYRGWLLLTPAYHVRVSLAWYGLCQHVARGWISMGWVSMGVVACPDAGGAVGKQSTHIKMALPLELSLTRILVVIQSDLQYHMAGTG